MGKDQLICNVYSVTKLTNHCLSYLQLYFIVCSSFSTICKHMPDEAQGKRNIALGCLIRNDSVGVLDRPKHLV